MGKFFNKKRQEKNIQRNKTKAYGVKNYIKNHPHLWRFDRESVSRGVGVGLFTGVVLFIPFQTLIAIFFAILLRANLPTAFLLSWISNPVTIFPIAYFTSLVGNWVLGGKGAEVTVSGHQWSFNNFSDFYGSFSIWILQFGKAYLVGLPIVAISLGFIGYVLAFFLWGISKRSASSKHK